MTPEQPKTILGGRKLTCLESIGALALLFLAVLLVIGLTVGKKSTTESAAVATPPAVAPQPVAAPPPEPAPKVAPAATLSPEEIAKRPAIAGSRAAFRGWFAKLGVPLEASSAVDGVPRELGAVPAKLITVETMGHGDLIEKATLIFGLEQGNTEALVAVTGAIMVFMRETGWKGGEKWVTQSLETDADVKKKHGGVAYQVKNVMPGMFVLSAEPALRLK